MLSYVRCVIAHYFEIIISSMPKSTKFLWINSISVSPQPSPPPPRAPTAPTIMNTLVPREQSAVPTINSTKGNLPPARAQIPPSSSSLVLKQQQPQKIGDGKTANSEQIERGQVTTREQVSDKYRLKYFQIHHSRKNP